MKRVESVDASIGPDYQRETFSSMLSTSAKFSRILNKLHTEYQDEEKKKYLIAPYTVMCAAALECCLNDSLIDHARELWKDDYKDFADAYLSMSLRTKLEMIVPVLTGNRYRINKESDV